jgi:hypothetical protein
MLDVYCLRFRVSASAFPKSVLSARFAHFSRVSVGVLARTLEYFGMGMLDCFGSGMLECAGAWSDWVDDLVISA